MKRMLLVLAAALVLMNTVVIPTVAHAEGAGACSGACKP